MGQSDLGHSDIIEALALLEAHQRSAATSTADVATGRLIVELRNKFGIEADEVDQHAYRGAEGPEEPSIWETSDVDNDLPELDIDWTERFRRAAVPSEDDQVELARDIEAGVIAEAALAGNWHLPNLWTAPELQTLVERGKAAFERMLSGNYRLVLYWARRYARGDADLMSDLFQDGFFGLVRAIQGWDYLRGYRFSTYATWQIRQAIQRGMYLRYSTAPVHLPIHILEELKSSRDGARDLSLNAALAQRWIEHRISWERLEEEVSDLTSRLKPDFETSIVSRLAMENSVRQVFKFLDDRSAIVLALRVGWRGGEPATLDIIGQRMKITRERVRQIEAKTLRAIRLRAL
jgi:RNA polymerase primary sigma factor